MPVEFPIGHYHYIHRGENESILSKCLVKHFMVTVMLNLFLSGLIGTHFYSHEMKMLVDRVQTTMES